jgi:hypothetical protein
MICAVDAGDFFDQTFQAFHFAPGIYVMLIENVSNQLVGAKRLKIVRFLRRRFRQGGQHSVQGFQVNPGPGTGGAQ